MTLGGFTPCPTRNKAPALVAEVSHVGGQFWPDGETDESVVASGAMPGTAIISAEKRQFSFLPDNPSAIHDLQYSGTASVKLSWEVRKILDKIVFAFCSVPSPSMRPSSTTTAAFFGAFCLPDATSASRCNPLRPEETTISRFALIVRARPETWTSSTRTTPSAVQSPALPPPSSSPAESYRRR